MLTGLTTSPEELEEVILKSLRERSLLADNAVVRRIIVKHQGTRCCCCDLVDLIRHLLLSCNREGNDSILIRRPASSGQKK